MNRSIDCETTSRSSDITNAPDDPKSKHDVRTKGMAKNKLEIEGDTNEKQLYSDRKKTSEYVC